MVQHYMTFSMASIRSGISGISLREPHGLCLVFLGGTKILLASWVNSSTYPSQILNDLLTTLKIMSMVMEGLPDGFLYGKLGKISGIYDSFWGSDGNSNICLT